jgi:hypothetical protein
MPIIKWKTKSQYNIIRLWKIWKKHSDYKKLVKPGKGWELWGVEWNNEVVWEEHDGTTVTWATVAMNISHATASSCPFGMSGPDWIVGPLAVRTGASRKIHSSYEMKLIHRYFCQHLKHFTVHRFAFNQHLFRTLRCSGLSIKWRLKYSQLR